SDADGTRLEVLTPVPPREYAGGARLVGPFATQAEADAWGGDNAVSALSYDTFATGGAWLVDLFDLPDQEPHGIEEVRRPCGAPGATTRGRSERGGPFDTSATRT